jgi:hypothetical protein
LWETAANLNEQFPGNGEFVPWRAIQVDESILPREQLDEDAITRYVEVFDQLPPIKVQRDTFILIGGKHRLFTAPKAMRDHVRIVEVDIPDDELWIAAFDDNRDHGVPMTMPERIKAGKRALHQHGEWSDQRIAQWAGISRQAVWTWRQKQVQSAPKDELQVVNGLQPDPEIAVTTQQPQARIGVDGRAYPVRPPVLSTVQAVPKPGGNGVSHGTYRLLQIPVLRPPDDAPDEAASAVPEAAIAEVMTELRRANDDLDAMREWNDRCLEALEQRLGVLA